MTAYHIDILRAAALVALLASAGLTALWYRVSVRCWRCKVRVHRDWIRWGVCPRCYQVLQDRALYSDKREAMERR